MSKNLKSGNAGGRLVDSKSSRQMKHGGRAKLAPFKQSEADKLMRRDKSVGRTRFAPQQQRCVPDHDAYQWPDSYQQAMCDNAHPDGDWDFEWAWPIQGNADMCDILNCEPATSNYCRYDYSAGWENALRGCEDFSSSECHYFFANSSVPNSTGTGVGTNMFSAATLFCKLESTSAMQYGPELQ